MQHLIPSDKFLDDWSTVHAINGFTLGAILGKRWRLGIPIIIIYEMVENSAIASEFLIERGYEPKEESLNVLGDILIGITFLYLGSKWREAQGNA